MGLIIENKRCQFFWHSCQFFWQFIVLFEIDYPSQKGFPFLFD